MYSLNSFALIKKMIASCETAQLVEHLILNQRVVGTIPLILNQRVVGSIPTFTSKTEFDM